MSPGPSSSLTQDSYFCSELVASALQSAAVLPLDLNPSYFWPGSFGTADLVDTYVTSGCSYDDELIVDFKINEIGGAVSLIPGCEEVHSFVNIEQRKVNETTTSSYRPIATFAPSLL